MERECQCLLGTEKPQGKKLARLSKSVLLLPPNRWTSCARGQQRGTRAVPARARVTCPRVPPGQGLFRGPSEVTLAGSFPGPWGLRTAGERSWRSRAEKYRVEEPLCRRQPFAGLCFLVLKEVLQIVWFEGLRVVCIEERVPTYLRCRTGDDGSLNTYQGDAVDTAHHMPNRSDDVNVHPSISYKSSAVVGWSRSQQKPTCTLTRHRLTSRATGEHAEGMVMARSTLGQLILKSIVQ